MRVSTQDWLTQGFDFVSTEATFFSGLVDLFHTVAIIPRSDEAKTDAMMNHGFVLEDEKNYTHYNNTMRTLGSVKAKVINLHCKGSQPYTLLTFGGNEYCRALLHSFTKNYKRVKDVFSILHGEKNMPLRFITPCGDWWILIAPRESGDTDEHQGYPISLDPFPIEVLQ